MGVGHVKRVSFEMQDQVSMHAWRLEPGLDIPSANKPQLVNLQLLLYVFLPGGVLHTSYTDSSS